MTSGHDDNDDDDDDAADHDDDDCLDQGDRKHALGVNFDDENGKYDQNSNGTVDYNDKMVLSAKYLASLDGIGNSSHCVDPVLVGNIQDDDDDC